MSRTLLALSLIASGGCASIPMDRYGVESLRIDGTDTMGEESVRSCLSTAPRSRFSLRAGAGAPSCGEPPFTTDAPRIRLWSWPWTEWPLFDRVAFEQDLLRIERWYAARGFHAARVVDTRVTPAEAEATDMLPEEEDAEVPCEREDDDEGCTVDLAILVEEGEPTLVREVTLHNAGVIGDEVRARIENAVTLVVGERFDEWEYNRTKSSIVEVMQQESYARAEVDGEVRIDRPNREARVDLRIDPGPSCVYGSVVVEGHEDLDEEIIRSAARFTTGDPYDPDDLDDAQRAVYALGAFSAVRVELVEAPRSTEVVDVRVAVTLARRSRFGLGIGIQSGVLTKSTFSNEQISVPQWDAHLIGRYTHRNFLGGLRQLTIENRPRIIFQETFPSVTRPRFGNVLSMETRAPGTIEARTTGKLAFGYEFGPDPFDVFFRHRFDTGIGAERPFFFAPLTVSAGIRNSIYLVPSGEETATGDPPPTDSVLTFFEQSFRLDYRDNPQRPHGGFFVQLTMHEAGFLLPSSWQYLRILPDVRVYVPLPLRMTLAARFALGMYFISEADSELDDLSKQLGPRDYRLRGGGASSNRGYLPGRLGDGIEGGTRRWEASVEWRVAINDQLGFVVFADAGDVSREERFRWDHLQLSVGGGLRFFTPIGAIRLDIAGRIPGAQTLGTDQRDPGAPDTDVSFGFTRFRGATHITIGEAF